MTREEAIRHIRDLIAENNSIKPNIVTFEQEKEALYMAIEALSADAPSGDLISRQDAIDALGEEPDIWNDTEEEWAYRNAWVEHISAIKALPSAEAVHKPDYSYEADMVRRLKEALSAEAVQGEWIITKEGEYDGRSVYKTVCSECGHETFYKAKKAHFCPNCGARMEGGDDE